MSTRREMLDLASGAAVGAATAGVPAAAFAHDSGPAGWVATWAAVPTTIPERGAPTVLTDQTVRHVAHCSTGGDELRIRLTNEFGETPLHVAAVHVALRAGSGASTAIVPGTDRRGTLSRRPPPPNPPRAPLGRHPGRPPLPARGGPPPRPPPP